MQLESLKIFCDVVRTASFSRGAAENGVSQSSASHAVSEIEKRLGVRLIDRSKRPLLLTPHGKVYFEVCRDIVARYFEVENRVKALENAQNVVGTVRVAAIYSVGLSHMSQYIERFQAHYTGSEVKVEYLHPVRVLDAVRDGDAELGIISFPRKWPDMVVLPWRDEPMVLAVNPAHPLAAHEKLGVRDLDGTRIIGFDAGLSVRRAIDRFLRQNGVAVQTEPEFDNIENIKRAVEELPSGMALLPEPTLGREQQAGTLVVRHLHDARMVRPLAIIHRRSDELSLPASHFLRLLRGGKPPDPASTNGVVGEGARPKHRGRVPRTAAGGAR